MSAELAEWAASLCLWLPVAIVVPAIGARGLPVSVRVALSFGLALAGPAPVELPASDAGLLPFVVRRLVLGLVLALGVARVMWAALLVGSVADRLGAWGALSHGDEEGAGPFEMLFGLTTMIVFFGGGGPARLAGAVADVGGGVGLESVAATVAGTALGAVTLAVTVAAPLLVAALLIELSLALIARAAWPIAWGALVPPLRALAFLVVTLSCFETMVSALARALLR